jgi:hypothetical protein
LRVRYWLLGTAFMVVVLGSLLANEVARHWKSRLVWGSPFADIEPRPAAESNALSSAVVSEDAPTALPARSVCLPARWLGLPPTPCTPT